MRRFQWAENSGRGCVCGLVCRTVIVVWRDGRSCTVVLGGLGRWFVSEQYERRCGAAGFTRVIAAGREWAGLGVQWVCFSTVNY